MAVGSLIISTARADSASSKEENTGVVSFTSGTAIRIPGGDVLIDDLRIDDLVSIADNGPQAVRWIGWRKLNHEMLATNPHLCSILIRREVLGAKRDLLISPQQGILMPGQTFVRANFPDEADGNPARIAPGGCKVTFIHLLFDAHQIIFDENILSQSFYPGRMAFAAIGTSAQVELPALLPEMGLTVDPSRHCSGPLTWYFASKEKRHVTASPPEFRAGAVRLAFIRGLSRKQVAADFGVGFRG